MVVKIFRMPNTMFPSVEFSISNHLVFCLYPFYFLFSSIQFSVFISCLMPFAFCSVIYFVAGDIDARLRDAGSSQSSSPQLPFLLMDDNALS